MITVAQIRQFLRSAISGFATPEVFERRLRSCFGADGVPPCPSLVPTEDGSGFCGACKCPKWRGARLKGDLLSKLVWRKLDCPLKRPGFTNSEVTQ